MGGIPLEFERDRFEFLASVNQELDRTIKRGRGFLAANQINDSEAAQIAAVVHHIATMSNSSQCSSLGRE
jgi:hypothetical protein